MLWGGRVGRAGGALALERPVGEDAWRRCDQGHLIALAGGTPRGLDRSSACAAEREGTGAAASARREGQTFRSGGVSEADGERAELESHGSSGGPATQAEKLTVSLFRTTIAGGTSKQRGAWGQTHPLEVCHVVTVATVVSM